MNTRDIVLVGAGVVVGYLLIGYLNKPKNNAQSSTGSTGSTTQTGGSMAVIDQEKIDACNKEVDNYMASARFAGGTDLVAVRKANFDACMARKS